MAGKSDRETLKLQAMQALDSARVSLRGGWAETREHLRPGNFIRDFVGKHQIAVLVASLAGGFVATKWVSSLFRSPAAAATTRKRSLAALLLSGVWGLAREPLIALATQQVVPVIMKYAGQFQPPQKTSTPE